MTTIAQDATTFIRTLFLPDDLVEIRAFATGGNAVREWCRAKDFGSPGIAALVERLRASCANVYVGANPRSRQGGKAEDVAMARCLFVDFDGCTVDQVRAELAKHAGKIPPPTLLVDSGHGAHAWWLLAEPITDMRAWTGYQKALIRVFESDPAIHDPPRIMRLPGTCNFKDDPPRECSIVGGTMQPVALAAFAIEPATDSARRAVTPPRTPGVAGDWKRGLCRDTLDYMVNGASDGERNRRLFAAACDAAGCGATFGEALNELGGIAERGGLDGEEVEQAVRSAFGKPRQAARPERPSGATEQGPRTYAAWGDSTGWGVDPKDAPPTAGAEPEPTPSSDVGVRIRRMISNVVRVAGTEDDKPKVYYKSIEQMAAEVKEAAGGWPGRVGSMLFAPREDSRDIPGMAAVWMLEKVDSMGAWFHVIADVNWKDGRGGGVQTAAGATASPATKGEVFEYMRANTNPQYRAISPLPHCPPMPGVYYIPCKLPASDGAALARLVDMLNPETENDRQLMLASLLTPGWGGGPGRRPPFVYSSTHGRGSGKSATVATITEGVWGGALSIKPDETFEKVIGRLLGNDGLGTRCVVMDNIKGKLSGQGIEGLITAPTIDGWRPHYGQFSRPNDLTYFITCNVARLSADLASRAVEIQVGKQRHDQSFIVEVGKFLEEYRPAILADIMARLAEGPRGKVSRENRDRWQDWQDAVLCRCENPDELAGLIIERREGIDDDREDASRVAESIRRYLRKDNKVSGAHRIGRDELRGLLAKDGVVEEGRSLKSVSTWVAGLLGETGPLRPLSDNKGREVRYWEWSWSKDSGSTEQTESEIPV